MSKEAVLVYDASGSCGYALYAPGMSKPRHGILRLPPTTTDGSAGPAFKLLFDHIAWADRCFGLAAIGYEAFLSPTGGKKDDNTTFTTSPKTLKRLIGTIATIELCAAMLGIQAHSIHNATWRSQWLGPQKRGTKGPRFKELAVAKAVALGWAPLGHDDAEAIGQLHCLLRKLDITPPWNTHAERDLITLAMVKSQ